MKTHLTTATRPAITSTAGALSDRELLRETSNLVRHERHLQGAIIDHLAEIEARGLYLERGFSSLFDYAVRELGYSDAAAARRRPLRAEGGHRRGVPAGAGAAAGAALARGPAHDAGAACRTPGQGGARPPRPEPATAPSAQRQSARGREGKRPANSDAGAGATEQRSGGEARRASGGHRGGAEDRPGRRPPRRSDAGVAAGGGATRRFDDEGRGGPRRRRSHTGAGGSADSDLRAAAEHPGGDGPPSRYRREADGRPSPPPSRARQVTA